MIDIKPTTRVLFFTKEAERIWRPRFGRIQKAYHKTELSTVIAGMRRVFVYHVYSNSFEQSYEFLRKNHLVFYPTNRSGIYEGFSHKHRKVEPGKPYMLYGAAVKEDDREAGELFTDGTIRNLSDHGGIGELLGYPKCCQEFFTKNWAKVSIDPIYEAALNTIDVKLEKGVATVKCHPYCNNMLRYFGIRITPHLTCSMQCKETIEWGKEWFDIMSQVDKEAADWAYKLLSIPLTWDTYKGVAIIDTDIFRAVTNSDTTLTKKIVRNLGWE